uniref:GDP-mannose 4,6-dehydratase n=1 Tax=Anoxybacillus sp. FSL W8-1294 TaxID=2954655 RepID=UPI00403FAA49
MWLMLQQDESQMTMSSQRVKCTVRELVEIAFSYVGLDWKDYVVQDERFVRLAEEDLRDCTKANEKLGWNQEVF